MPEITDALREGKRLRLLACALELLQHERIDSAVIAIPGTESQRYVVIGTAATIGKLLEIEEQPTIEPDEETGSIMQDVIDTFRGAGFEVREDLGADHPFAVAGSIDSAAILMEATICGAEYSAPAGYLTDAQITAGAAVKCDHGQPIGRNVAIDVFDAMKPAGQEGGAA